MVLEGEFEVSDFVICVVYWLCYFEDVVVVDFFVCCEEDVVGDVFVEDFGSEDVDCCEVVFVE